MARGAEQGPVLRLVALVPAALAALATIYIWRWHGPVGLDFEGGTQIVVRPPGDIDRALDAVRAWLDREPLPELSIVKRGGDIVIEYASEDAVAARALADRLAKGGGFEICDVATTGGRVVRSKTGESVAVGAPPLFEGADVRDVQVAETGVMLELRDGDRMAQLSGARVGKHLALVVGDELLMAPEVRERIGARLQISSPTEPPELLARRLRAAILPKLEVVTTNVIAHARPSWQGKPLLYLLGVLAFVLSLGGLASPWAPVCAAIPLAWVVAAATDLFMGWTFSFGVQHTGMLVAVPAAVTAVLAARATGGTWSRANAAWPGWALFVVIVALAPRLASEISPGPFRAALKYATWPALAAAIATLAIVRALADEQRA